ncbi:MAG: hypothetical protein EAZ94_15175 [Oscillatoriales cyanobacterium]|nr:MAG: hypothetical protein EAZ94_15175 [Oscillatoriales cyanobacterium]TAE23566.1 MAG: hypothetical protein EAZ93_15185 [Oscillatoriales cyanobacterium]
MIVPLLSSNLAAKVRSTAGTRTRRDILISGQAICEFPLKSQIKNLKSKIDLWVPSKISNPKSQIPNPKISKSQNLKIPNLKSKI